MTAEQFDKFFVDAKKAFDHAVAKGAEPYEGDDKTMDVPAIKGIGGSLIYFIDQYYETSPYNEEFEWLKQSKHCRRHK